MNNWRILKKVSDDVARRADNSPAVLLLLTTVAMAWLGVGVYSAYATYQGFERLNWGLMALIVTALAQTGSMSYQFVTAELTPRKTGWSIGLSVIACTAIILLGIIFHAVSFLGSIYHHREASLVSKQQRNVGFYLVQLRSIEEAVKFNLEIPSLELDKLASFYMNKAEEERTGTGITEQKSIGPYAKAYLLLVQACRNQKALFRNEPPPPPRVIGEKTKDTEAFKIVQGFFASIPVEARAHSSPELSIQEWRRGAPKPRVNSISTEKFEFDPLNFTIASADALIKQHFELFPYKPVPAPRPFQGAPQEVVEGTFSLFKDLHNKNSPVAQSSAQAGLIGASLTEFLMVVLNFAVAVVFWKWQRRPRLSPLGQFIIAREMHIAAGQPNQAAARTAAESLNALRQWFTSFRFDFEIKQVGNDMLLDLGENLESFQPRQENDILLQDFILIANRSNLIVLKDRHYLLHIGLIGYWLTEMFSRISSLQDRTDFPQRNKSNPLIKREETVEDLLRIGLTERAG